MFRFSLLRFMFTKSTNIWQIIDDAYSVDSIKRTVHLAFHGLTGGIFNRDFLKSLLKTEHLIETVCLIKAM